MAFKALAIPCPPFITSIHPHRQRRLGCKLEKVPCYCRLFDFKLFQLPRHFQHTYAHIMASRCTRIARSCSQLSPPTSSSAARTFLQLAPRSYLHSGPPPPILDFLLPSISSSLKVRGGVAFDCPFVGPKTQRGFASSSKHYNTTTIFNPRQDEDGGEMKVEITHRASNV